MINVHSNSTNRSPIDKNDPVCINNASLMALQKLKPWVDSGSGSEFKERKRNPTDSGNKIEEETVGSSECEAIEYDDDDGKSVYLSTENENEIIPLPAKSIKREMYSCTDLDKIRFKSERDLHDEVSVRDEQKLD